MTRLDMLTEEQYADDRMVLLAALADAEAALAAMKAEMVATVRKTYDEIDSILLTIEGRNLNRRSGGPPIPLDDYASIAMSKLRLRKLLERVGSEPE